MIPKSIQLAGLKINVVLDSQLYNKKKIVGEARYPSQEIVLDTTMLNLQSLQQNFYHELIHWIFYVLNEDTLRANEKLVDTTAYLLHQGLASGKDFYTEEELMKDFVGNG